MKFSDRRQSFRSLNRRSLPAMCAFTAMVIDLGDLQDSRTWLLKLKSGTVANPK